MWPLAGCSRAPGSKSSWASLAGIFMATDNAAHAISGPSIITTLTARNFSHFLVIVHVHWGAKNWCEHMPISLNGRLWTKHRIGCIRNKWKQRKLKEKLTEIKPSITVLELLWVLELLLVSCNYLSVLGRSCLGTSHSVLEISLLSWNSPHCLGTSHSVLEISLLWNSSWNCNCFLTVCPSRGDESYWSGHLH